MKGAPEEPSPSIHASCVLVGDKGVLIRGASGTGKSRLAFALVLAGGSGLVPQVSLVADDRVLLHRRDNRLYACAPQQLEGLIEIRGAGVRRLPFTREAAIDLVVDLGAPDAARLPESAAGMTIIQDVEITRLPAYASGDVLQQVLAMLLTGPGIP